MSKNLSFLGIDIGGAHIKLVGLDEKQNVIIVKYRTARKIVGLI